MTTTRASRGAPRAPTSGVLALALAVALLAAPRPAAAADTTIDSLRTALVSMPPDTNRVMTLHKLSIALFFAHSDSAFAPALEGEHLARRQNFWRGIMLSLYAQGLAYWGGNRYDDALRKYEQAMELAVALNADQVRFKLVNNMGVVYNVMGDQAAAIKAYHECLELAPKVGAEQHVPLILMNVGNIYAYVDDHESALDYFRRGAEMVGAEQTFLAASLWSNMGAMWQKLGRNDEALKCSRRSLEIRMVLGDPALVATGRSRLAGVMHSAGRSDTAAVLVGEALPVLRGQPDREKLADALLTFGEVELELGRPAAARVALLEALDLAESLGEPRQRRSVHGALSRVEAALGNDAAVARHAAAYVALVDSLSDVTRVREVARLEAEFEARVRLALVEQRRRADRRFAVVTSAGVVLLLLVLARLYRVQKRLNGSLNERNDRLESEVSARTEELRALSQHLVRLREDERRRIARDIHDDLSQALTAIRLNLSHIRMKNGDGELDAVIGRTSDMAAAALKESSRLIRDLRPIALEELGLCGALRWLGDRHRSLSRAAVTVTVPESVGCEQEKTLVLFRIAQEALHNILKHAEAGTVVLSLVATEPELMLTISDDGRGFARREAGGGSYGLLGMEEAARSVGGSFQVTSAPGEGTRIVVLLPC